MTTALARIERVLRHAPRALVHAIDAEGHEYKIEMPVDAAASITAGDALVLTWSTHAVPERVAEKPDLGPPPVPSGNPDADAAESVDRQFEALLGLGRSTS